MSKEMSIIALGIWVVIIPYLGVPSSWRTVLLVLTGIGIAVIGFLIRSEALSRGIESTERHPFVENTPAPASSERYEQKEGITSLN